jgi:hypothetical protein
LQRIANESVPSPPLTSVPRPNSIYPWLQCTAPRRSGAYPERQPARRGAR